MGGRNETEQNGYTQPTLDGLEAPSSEETELANCLELSQPVYKDTGNEQEWVCRVHAQQSIFQLDTDTVFLSLASNGLAISARRKSLKPGDRVVLTGITTSRTISFANGERQTINCIALTHAPQITAREKRISTTVFEQNRRR